MPMDLSILRLYDEEKRLHLWRSDGTSSGTVQFESLPLDATLLTSVGNQFFFSAPNTDYGREPWKIDGITGEIMLVKDIGPGKDGSGPGHFTDHNGTLIFSATDSAHGHELWRSDGTASGTQLLKDIWPGTTSSSPDSFFSANG